MYKYSNIKVYIIKVSIYLVLLLELLKGNVKHSCYSYLLTLLINIVNGPSFTLLSLLVFRRNNLMDRKRFNRYAYG